MMMNPRAFSMASHSNSPSPAQVHGENKIMPHQC